MRIPGIVYGKSLISPGRPSDELFDVMDLFGVGLQLAGISTDVSPADRHHDFAGEISFLLHNEGRSKREVVYFWWDTKLTACRMREYTAYVKVILPHSPHRHIDLATIHDVSLVPCLFNLYGDPKEETTVRHERHA